MQKICVVGNTASGKSFFVRQVGDALSLPVFHLDQIYWSADWSHLSRADFREHQKELIARPQWVIDGCFSEFGLEERFQSADAIVFIDQPALTCAKRAIERRGTARADLPAGADDTKMSWRLGLAFLTEILLFNLLDRPRILRAARKANAPLFTIHQWEEEPRVLAKLREE